MLRVRLAQIEDRDVLAELVANAFGYDSSLGRTQFATIYKHLWDWKFVKNPHNTVRGPSVFVAEDNGEIVGQRAMMPFTLKLCGEEVSAAWGVDFAVRSDRQRQGIGRQLLERWFEAYDVCAALGSTLASVSLYRKIKLVEIRPVYYMVKVLRVSEAVMQTQGWRRKVFIFKPTALVDLRK